MSDAGKGWWSITQRTCREWIWSQPSRTKQTVRLSCGTALSHFGVQESCIRTWIVLACRMARGTDQVFIHVLLRAGAQTSIGERHFRFIGFHWWGPKKTTHPIPKKRGGEESRSASQSRLAYLPFDTSFFDMIYFPHDTFLNGVFHRSLEVTMSDIRSLLSSSQSRKDLHG